MKIDGDKGVITDSADRNEALLCSLRALGV